jgi:hypothetical protein
MTKDDPKVCEFMKNADVSEILANKELWGEDLSCLLEDVKKAIN